MMNRYDGRVAIVTGGASGIGRACSVRLAAEGARVLVADLDAERGAETVAALTADGAVARFVATDTSSVEANDAMVAAAVDAWGQVDVLVAAAGVSSASYVSGKPEDSVDIKDEDSAVLNKDPEDWKRVLDINLTGVMLSNRAFARAAIAAERPAAIVNIASVAAKVPLPGAADYCVSKAGVWMLTKVLALELVEAGIRVNAVGPGFIDTPMTARMQDDPEDWELIQMMTPMGRMGTPEEIAATTAFLGSDEASFTTGQILFPSGGLFTG